MGSNHNIDTLKLKIKNLSENPGVYQFFNKDKKHIYVGKAKNLRKRVLSYFNKNHTHDKVRTMVKNIVDIQCIVVNTEQDALLLENNLIKKYNPRYNVMFRDDKSYPWICIKNEHFPRVFLTRNIIKDSSKYYGPYTSIIKVRTLLNVIKTLYQLRTCRYNLSPENIKKKKIKRCLEYHLENCKAPCEGLQTEKEYAETIHEIKLILNGNMNFIMKFVKNKMNELAKDLKFEEAQKLKEKLEFLKDYQGKSEVVSPRINNLDVFSYVDDEQHAYVNFLNIINGAVSQSYTLILKKKMNESRENLLILAIVEIRQKIPSRANTIILPFPIDYQLNNMRYLYPQRGEKFKLLNLSKLNALNAKKEKLRQTELMNKKNKSKIVLKKLQHDLRLKTLPNHIECFDNSNLQGSNPVAACVVFKNGKPSRKNYRHFNIKSVEGIDDFLSMQEIVFRRYARLIKGKKSLPQLIIIDGGKGQLNAAIKSLKKLKIYNKTSIIGIAKRLEKIFLPNDPIPIYLDKKSESLRLIQHIRNEAHRFSITFHKQKRSKNFLVSELKQIKGIGEKTTNKLLENLKSVENIKTTEFKKIAAIVGKKKAQIVVNYFKKNTE